MNGLLQLDFFEGFLVIGLIGLIAWELQQSLSSRSWVEVYRPTLVVAAVFGYYVLVGPILALGSEQGASYRGLNHREVLVWGWLGAFLSYAALLLGFYASPQQSLPRRLILRPDPERLHRFGSRLCQLGLVMFGLVSGVRLVALLNPLAAARLLEGEFGEGGFDVGAVANYFNYAVNFLIPGILLIAAAWMRTRRHTVELVLWSLSSAAIYISLGFRYRLVLLAIPILLLWFMARRRRPSLPLLAMFLVGFITLNGLIGLTRSYGRGLDLNAAEGQGAVDYFNEGFSEAAVFFTTAGVIEQTPSRAPFVGADPLIATVLFPIPRALFPGKPDATYLKDAISQLYGGAKFSQGAAFLNFAEYYLIAGWPSLIAFSAVLGWLLRRLWNWFLIRQNEPFAQVLYLLSSSYLYVVISRGYLPQVILLFAFTVAPAYWLYGRWATPVSIQPRATPSAPPLPRR